MFRKVVCPYCFETFDPRDVLFRCSNQTGCKKSDDPSLHAFWGSAQSETPSFAVKKRLLGLIMPDSAECPHCGSKTHWMICPHCHNRLPRLMVKKKGYLISIIGARSSGKTNYITTLINELKYHGDSLGGIGTIASNVATKPENNTETRYDRDFFDIVYRRRKCPPQTAITDARSKIPLIYELAQKRKQPLYLVIYDTAGENFADPRNIAANVKYLEKSDACIYLLDTLAIPYVHDVLKPRLGLAPIELRFDRIIDNIIGHFREGSPRLKRRQFKKPMALVFSKVDAVLANEDLFRDTSIEGMDIGRNSPFLDGTGVSLDDMESVSDGIRGALYHKWKEVNFVHNIDNNFKKVHYFGVSALGSMPDKNGNISNLRPYRVLDPLVWILHEFHYSLPLSQ